MLRNKWAHVVGMSGRILRNTQAGVFSPWNFTGRFAMCISAHGALDYWRKAPNSFSGSNAANERDRPNLSKVPTNLLVREQL